jgi:hypothetical protein
MSFQCIYKLGVIAYFNLNREYIAKEICINKEKPMSACYGQCFLKTNLDLTDESSTDDAELPPARQTIDFPVFLISEISSLFDIVTNLAEANFHYIPGTSVDHSLIPFRPPQSLIH